MTGSVPEASNEKIKPNSAARARDAEHSNAEVGDAESGNAESRDSKPRDSKSGLGGRKKFPSPRSGRLLRHADFERVYKEGRRHFSANMTVFYLARKGAAASLTDGLPAPEMNRDPAVTGMRVGFTVGRVLGGAVVRNRMKRRLREAVRLTRQGVEVPADVVINPKKSLLMVEFENILNEVRRAFGVIEQKVGP